MGIFFGATLAGFLFFGWIKAIPKRRNYFQKLRLQSVLGVAGWLALFALALFVLVLTTQWPSYEVFRIVQNLTGRETAHLILGAAFGCILRYWWPRFWVTRMPRRSRYNWVAISLVGLLLLAAASPYIGSLLRDSSVTGIKTPVAEFRFAEKGKVRLPDFEKDLQSKELTNLEKLHLMRFPSYLTEIDLKYLDLFPNAESARHRGIYKLSRDFTAGIMIPISQCALDAHKNYMDLESIQHALQPIAQKLFLLIKQGALLLDIEPQGSTMTENVRNLQETKQSLVGLPTRFLRQVRSSFKSLNEAFVEDKCTLSDLESLKDLVDPRVLADAPHIYFALASLDAFNHNMDRTIFLLESASRRFLDAAPGVSFHINFSLAFFLLQEGKHDSKTIFMYLDKALEIARKAGRNISKLKDLSSKLKASKYFVLQQLEFDKTHAKNFIAYISAREGIRKFEALQYARHNYNNRGKLDEYYWPDIIDTYGYVKMAFEARRTHPNFDEIEEARALFKEAKHHILEWDHRKHEKKELLEERIKQANMLLEHE